MLGMLWQAQKLKLGQIMMRISMYSAWVICKHCLMWCSGQKNHKATALVTRVRMSLSLGFTAAKKSHWAAFYLWCRSRASIRTRWWPRPDKQLRVEGIVLERGPITRLIETSVEKWFQEFKRAKTGNLSPPWKKSFEKWRTLIREQSVWT